MSIKHLSRIARCEEAEATVAIKELVDVGVLKLSEEGVIFIPRLVKDREKAILDYENGQRGGNPSLTNKGVKNPKKLTKTKVNPQGVKGVNPPVNPPVNPEEEREEEEEREIEESSLRSDSPAPTASGPGRETDEGAGNSGREKSPPAGDGGFEEWWALYGRLENECAAKKQFPLALEEVSFDELMSATARFVAAREPTFRPSPARWLKEKRWRDVLPVPAAEPDPAPLTRTMPPRGERPEWEARDHTALSEWEKAEKTGNWQTLDARRNAMPPQERKEDLLETIRGKSPKAYQSIMRAAALPEDAVSAPTPRVIQLDLRGTAPAASARRAS